MSRILRDSFVSRQFRNLDSLQTFLWLIQSIAALIVSFVVNSASYDVKYIWNNSFLNCGCNWKWRMHDHRSKSSNLSNWKEEDWKNQGFNGIRTRDLRVTGALLYQLSYEATYWERGQFIEFISPLMSEMMWSIYEIIHFWTAVVE